VRLSGQVCKARSSKAENAVIELGDGKATIFVDGVPICKAIEIESIQAGKEIYLKNGFLFALETALTRAQEKPLLGRLERSVSWLENFSIGKAVLLSLLLLSALIMFRLMLTALTPLTVAIFPYEWEAAIGRNTYQTLEQTAFEESELSTVRIDRLRDKVVQLAAANGLQSPEILFHKSDLIGANALAFPGGPIVVTDDLVLLLQRDDLVLAVIAHELAHVAQRHSLHQLIEVIGVTAIASVLLGADETLIEEASLVGISVWANKKSRGFEREADLMALAYLERGKMKKSSFAEAIERLVTHFCKANHARTEQECLSDTQTGWFSSHPTGAERLAYLRDNL